MFQRIKNLVSQIGMVWKYGGAIRSVTTALANYPGLDDSDALRLWIRPLLVDASALALLTKTSIDDMVVYASLKVVDNNHSWSAVHAMALLVRDGVGIEGVLVPGQSGDLYETSKRIAEETMPECPAAVMAAIGVILFILQRKK